MRNGILQPAALIGALLLVPTGTGPALGQTPPEATRLEAEAHAARTALDTGAPAAALAHLQAIAAADPAYVSPALDGAAAYWLGMAFRQAGAPEQAHRAWREGLLALNERGLFDPRLADAFIWDTFEHGHHDDQILAAAAYLNLLAALDASDDPAVHALLVPHLHGLRVILPAHLAAQTGLNAWTPQTTPPLAPGAGARLVAWWRSQDAAPATRHNERLIEHLARVAHARTHYAFDEGLDARAYVYIRLGEPARRTRVQFDRTAFRNKVLDRSLTLNESVFLDNEFWYYAHLGPDAHYLFYNRDGHYEIGEIRDLLPPSIRNGVGVGPRGQRKAEAVVRTLEEIYRQLSMYHDDFAGRYQDVAAFSSLLDDQETVERAERWKAARRRDGSVQDDGDAADPAGEAVPLRAGTGASLPGSVFSADQPHLFAQHIIQRGQTEDAQIATRRAENVPATYTNVFDDVEPLPAMARVARFLEPDGTTRTEVYWGTPPGALHPSRARRRALRRDGVSADGYLLVATLVQQDAAFRERSVHVHRHVVRDLADAPDASIAPVTYTVTGDTGTYHVALQWDQYAASLNARGELGEVGPRLKANTFRADTLTALAADGRRLEMSDLKPLLVPVGQDGSVEAAFADAVVYPSSDLPEGAPLALYFEVYHLAYDATDRTAYEVEYEVQRTERGRRAGARTAILTSAATRYTGTERTAREYILVDLSEARAGDRLAITVRVTDRTSGQQRERTLRYRIVPR